MVKIINQTSMQQAPSGIFDPNAEIELKRRRRLAEQLIKEGSQASPTEYAPGGQVPVAIRQSPLAALARAMQTGVGNYEQLQADKSEAQIAKDKAARMGEAINTGKLGGFAQGSPEEQQFALQQKLSQQEEARKFSQAKELAMMKAAGSGGGVTVDPESGALTYEAPNTGPQSNPKALAAAMGVPSVPSDIRGLSAKDASMYNRRTREDAQKILNSDDVAGALNKANSNKLDATRFNELMQVQPTGGWRSIPGATTVAGWADPQIREMNAIQDRLTPQQRAPGSGSTSNFDAAMFKNALPGADKPQETNKNISAAIIAKSNDEQQYQSFRSDYLQANGHLNGADKAWQTYIDANPIFDPKNATPEDMVLNPKRVDYKTYFQGNIGEDPELPNQSPGQPLEGSTATNKTTGQKLTFKGGQWVPAQ